MTAKEFSGRTVLVTGSGRNLGRAAILEFADRGANVVVSARTNREEAQAVAHDARSWGAEAMVVLGDVSDPSQVMAWHDEIRAGWGPLTCLSATRRYGRSARSGT